MDLCGKTEEKNAGKSDKVTNDFVFFEPLGLLNPAK